jgi:hypothetical protein
MPNVQALQPPQLLLDAPAGRAGDWSEPLLLQGLAADALDAVARQRGLPVDLLVGLLLERELLLGDLASAGIAASDAIALLDDASSRPRPLAGPGRLHAHYVRYLARGDYAVHESALARPLMIPLRLHEAARQVEAATLEASHVASACAWELAAAAVDRFMRDWGLLVALRAERG